MWSMGRQNTEAKQACKGSIKTGGRTEAEPRQEGGWTLTARDGMNEP